jgi:hypothetical protein
VTGSRPTSAAPAPRLTVAFVAALALALLAGCGSLELAATPAERPAAGQEILATLEPGNERIWSHVAGELEVLFGVRLRAAWMMRSLGEQCLLLDLPAGRDVAGTVAGLERHPRVATVTATRRFEVLGTGDDPYAHLQVAAAPLQLALAHRVASGRGVSIAIVDTGLEIDHPDLAGRVRRASDFVGRERGAFTSEMHGTAVAGVVAARAGNGVGGVGVAPEAELWALRACWQEPATSRSAVCDSYTLAQALDLAIAEGARVVNLSLAGERDALVERLIRVALERKVVVIAAAEGAPPSFPASIPGVIAVHAWSGERPAPRGARIPDGALVAPGVDILTTVPRGGFDFVSGSSFSAAQASGVVALLLEQRPELGPAEIEELLRLSARPVAAANGPRLLDACAALSRTLGRELCAGE